MSSQLPDDIFGITKKYIITEIKLPHTHKIALNSLRVLLFLAAKSLKVRRLPNLCSLNAKAEIPNVERVIPNIPHTKAKFSII